MNCAFSASRRFLAVSTGTSIWQRTAPSILRPPVPSISAHSFFSTKEAKKKKGKQTSDENAPGAYWASKRAAKDRRRDLYNARQERKERVKVRRAGRPRLFYRQQFRSFFIPKKVREEFLHRKARQAGMDWEYRVATVLERIPIVMADHEPFEKEWEELQDHLGQFGKEYPKEFVGDMYEKFPKRLSDEELLEMLPFTPAPRETEADETGDVKTTERKLKTRLYLAVREDDQWQFPTVPLEDDTTLLEAAQQALKVKVGTAFDYWCPSNAPWSVDVQAFPEEKQKETGLYGVKTFFVKVQLDEPGEIDTKTIQDFGWLEREEMVERVQKEQGDTMSRLYHYML